MSGTLKQVTLNIKDDEYQFFKELVNSLDFVLIDNEEDSKESILMNIKKGLKEVKLTKQGKLITTPVKDFLSEF